MKYFQQWNHVQKILDTYDATMPLSRFLSNYFRQNKQMGSRDRRFAMRYVYSFYRLGFALPDLDPALRVAIADFLCNTDANSPISMHFLPDSFKEKWELPLIEKLILIQNQWSDFSYFAIFPHQVALSQAFSVEKWAKRLLVQPDLFIRVRSGNISRIEQQLKQAQIAYKLCSNNAISLPNASKLENILSPDTYEVQDLSSQQTAQYFKPSAYEYWWDCCAASGGKSLLLHSLCPTVKILASDIRPQILDNLKQRFSQAGIQKFQVKTLDLLQNNKAQMTDYSFDGILVDAPCSGSGTWARTPENNVYFDSQKLSNYTFLQQNIVKNVVPYLKQGKPLVYITCSIFAEENELMVEKILHQNPALILESAQLIDGSSNNADTMFVARFIKK